MYVFVCSHVLFGGVCLLFQFFALLSFCVLVFVLQLYSFYLLLLCFIVVVVFGMLFVFAVLFACFALLRVCICVACVSWLLVLCFVLHVFNAFCLFVWCCFFFFLIFYETLGGALPP